MRVIFVAEEIVDVVKLGFREKLMKKRIESVLYYAVNLRISSGVSEKSS